jgi:uncharacterized RDD family membrane protein YckC
MEKNAVIQSGEEVQTIPVIGFDRRLAATLIDGLILLVATFMLTLAVGTLGVFANLYTGDRPIPVNALIAISGLILSLLYYVVAWSKSGQTIAKSVFGIKVVGKDGQPLSVGRALLRYLGYIVSGVILSLGFLWIAFDKKHQGWHDKIASSYAVDAQTDIYSGQKFKFVATDTKSGWLWLVIWLMIAAVVPTALLGSLFVMGPILGQMVTELLLGLR